MLRFTGWFTLAAFLMECWEFVEWGPWFWATVATLDAAGIGLLALERLFPRTWRTLRREAGMYRSVIGRWLLEKAVTRK